MARMKETKLDKVVLDSAFKVHTAVGPGLLESVYETLLAYELSTHGIEVQRQVPIPIRYRGLCFEEGFRADLVVPGELLVELKAIERLMPVHARQVLTQLRMSGHGLGLLINFGAEHLKDGVQRIVNSRIFPL